MAAPIDAVSNSIAYLSPEFQRAYQLSAQAEQKSIQLVQNQKGTVDKKIELFTDVVGKVEAIKSLLPNLNTPNALRELLLKSSDDKVAIGTVDKRVAEPGSHSLEVLQLATQASALSNGFPDRDSTTIGSGFFSFETANGDTKEVFIDADNATLDGVARLINDSKIGVRASVVEDVTDPDYPWKLVLTANGVGSKNGLEYPDFYLIDGQNEFFIEQEKPAQNALIRYQGMDVEAPSNELTDLIRGVTLNLKGMTEGGRPVTLTVDQDIPKTTQKLKDLVERVNQVFTFIQTQNTMDEKTDTTQTLGGDFSLRVSEQRLRTALSQNFLSDETKYIKSLADIGVQFNKKGTLSIDEKKLENAVNGHFEEVADLLSGDGLTYGIIPTLGRTLDSLSSGQNGVLASPRKMLTDQSQRLSKDIGTREKYAAERQEQLKLKLSRAQTAINRIQQQGSAMTSQGSDLSIASRLISNM